MTKTQTQKKTENTTKKTGLLIERIQIKENRALIKLVEEDDFKRQTGDFNVKDEVTTKFAETWNSALDIFKELCPIFSKDLHNCTLNCLKFSYDNNGFLQDVLFSVVYKFGKSGYVTNINLPKIPIYKPEMDEHTVAVSGKHEELLHEIIKYAKAYMKGDTKVQQMKLIVDNEVKE